MLQRFSLGGIDIFVTKLQPDINASQRKCTEQKVIDQLIKKVFGEKAQLEHNADGSPFIIGSNKEISISHSRSMATLAIGSDKRFGIDVEEWRDTLQRVRPKYLSAQESETWVTCDDMLIAWTAKEAAYKAAGIFGLDFSDDILLFRNDSNISATVKTKEGNTMQYDIFTTKIDLSRITVAIPSLS